MTAFTHPVHNVTSFIYVDNIITLGIILFSLTFYTSIHSARIVVRKGVAGPMDRDRNIVARWEKRATTKITFFVRQRERKGPMTNVHAIIVLFTVISRVGQRRDGALRPPDINQTAASAGENT